MDMTEIKVKNLMIYPLNGDSLLGYTYDCHKCPVANPEDAGMFYADIFDTMPEAVNDRRAHIAEYHPDVTVTDHHGREHVVKFDRSVKVFRNGFLQTVKVCESRYDAEQWVKGQQMTTSAYRSTHYQYEIV
jgi:hypothetical protein